MKHSSDGIKRRRTLFEQRFAQPKKRKRDVVEEAKIRLVEKEAKKKA
jgi:hypothetical protein